MCARLASREVVMKAEGMPENRAKCREETFDVEAPWMERIWAGRAQGESARGFTRYRVTQCLTELR